MICNKNIQAWVAGQIFKDPDHIHYYENEKSDHNDLTNHSLTHLLHDYDNYEYDNDKLINYDHDSDNYKSDHDYLTYQYYQY